MASLTFNSRYYEIMSTYYQGNIPLQALPIINIVDEIFKNLNKLPPDIDANKHLVIKLYNLEKSQDYLCDIISELWGDDGKTRAPFMSSRCPISFIFQELLSYDTELTCMFVFNLIDNEKYSQLFRKSFGTSQDCIFYDGFVGIPEYMEKAYSIGCLEKIYSLIINPITLNKNKIKCVKIMKALSWGDDSNNIGTKMFIKKTRELNMLEILLKLGYSRSSKVVCYFFTILHNILLDDEEQILFSEFNLDIVMNNIMKNIKERLENMPENMPKENEFDRNEIDIAYGLMYINFGDDELIPKNKIHTVMPIRDKIKVIFDQSNNSELKNTLNEFFEDSSGH